MFTVVHTFRFGIEQDEDSILDGVLNQPRVPGLKGPEPLLSNANRILQALACLSMQGIRFAANTNFECKASRVVHSFWNCASTCTLHAPILSVDRMAEPRLTRSASPVRLIPAGQSGQRRRIIFNHCSSFWQKRRGREYSTEPS